MRVLIDTCVWSLVLRRGDPDAVLCGMVQELISEGRAVMLGPVRQELLSGIRSRKRFTVLRDHLAAFADEPIGREDYETAAAMYHTCRGRGIQGSQIDFLICAVACNHQLQILSSDPDFVQYGRMLPIQRLALP